MSDDDKQKEKGLAFFMESFKHRGAAVSTVKDGHVILFSREFLEHLMKNPDQKEFIIFLKQPVFNN